MDSIETKYYKCEDFKGLNRFLNECVLALDPYIAQEATDNIFFLIDRRVWDNWSVELSENLDLFKCERKVHAIIVDDVCEKTKTIRAMSEIVRDMVQKGANKHSILINIGGGIITDMGGFIASSFYRGLKFINIPTTVLCMADAAIGGKTGLNLVYGDVILKNMIGAYYKANMVISCSRFLESLPTDEYNDGMAEVIKSYLVSNPTNLDEITRITTKKAIEVAQEVKVDICHTDPRENGLRTILNLGHTYGHALEGSSLGAVKHGQSVILGILYDMIVSNLMNPGTVPEERIAEFVWISRPIIMDILAIGDKIYEYMDPKRLIEISYHDKKNTRPDEIVLTIFTDYENAKPNEYKHIKFQAIPTDILKQACNDLIQRLHIIEERAHIRFNK